MKHHPMKAIS